MPDPFGFGTNLLGVTARPSTDARILTATDTFAVDCTNATTQDGTEISAGWLDEVSANLKALLRGNGDLVAGGKIVTEDNSDGMLLSAVQQLIQRGRPLFALDTGTSGSALVGTVTPSPPELLPGMCVHVVAAHDAQAGATYKHNGFAGAAILRRSGHTVVGGDWAANDILTVIWTGSAWMLSGLVVSDVVSLIAANTPTRVTADQTITVDAVTGSDTTPGTAGAFKTLQAARNYAKNTFNLNGQYSVFYNCNGAFTAGVVANGIIAGQSGPANEVFSFTSGSSVTATNNSCLAAYNGAQFTVQAASGSVLLSTSGSAVGLGHAVAAIYGGSQIQVGAGINFGTCYAAHVAANGGIINLNNNYTISGGAQCHWNIIAAGGYIATNIASPQTITLTGTPAFSLAFVYTRAGNVSCPGLTFSGSATGKRYDVDNASGVSTNAGGSNYLPGNVAGTGGTAYGYYA